MILKVVALVEAELRGGQCLVIMQPKLLSSNMRGLNEVDQRLRVRNLLR
jgi:hypothetical protein